MNKLKKAVAALAASAMMFSMTGCSDTRYAMTYNNGEKVNAGVYIYNLYNEMSYQMTMAYYSSGSAELDLDGDIEGQKMRDYLVEQARKATREYAAISYEFEKLGLTLTEDETKAISDNVAGVWEANSELMESEGISKESIKQVYRAQTMRTRLFDYFYGAEGTEAVSDDELKKYVEDNFIKYKAVRITKSDAEDEAEAKAENEENAAVRDEYLAMAEGLSYDEFDEVIDAYSEYAQAKLEAETSDAEDTSDEIAAPVLGDETDTSVDAPADEEGLEEAEVLDEAAEAVDLDEALTDDETADADAEESNPNESMYNYGAMDDDAKESITGKLAEFIHGLDYDKAAAYEDDSFYYIVIRGDVTENSAKYAENNRDNLVQTMKGDEFQAKIDSWVDEIGISENKEAIKRYTAQAVLDKQNDYYAKIQ